MYRKNYNTILPILITITFLIAVTSFFFLGNNYEISTIFSAQEVSRNSRLTPQQALDLVRNLPEVLTFKKLFTDNGKGPVTGGIPVVEIQDENRDTYVVEVYEHIDGNKDGLERNPSSGVFYVNKITGEVKKNTDTPFEILLTNGLPHNFSEFPATPSKQKSIKLKFEDNYKLVENPNYWNDWQNIFSDISSTEYDFAGHYKFVNYKNGTMLGSALVDSKTGIIINSKILAPLGSKFYFREGSKLLISEVNNIYGFVPNSKVDKVYYFYYLEDDGTFSVIDGYEYQNERFTKI